MKKFITAVLVSSTLIFLLAGCGLQEREENLVKAYVMEEYKVSSEAIEVKEIASSGQRFNGYTSYEVSMGNKKLLVKMNNRGISDIEFIELNTQD